jgi:hypothetical protein
MRRRRTLRHAFLVATIFLTLGNGAARGQESELSQQVAAAVAGAARMLERKEYAAFVKTYLRPSELEELLAKYESVEKIAAEFTRRDRHVTMLARLQAAAKGTPTFSREGTIATYRFDPPVDKERGLSLQKIGDRWYLRD